MYFRQQMIESREFAEIGSWWQGKNNKDQDEVDIVGLYTEEKKALVAEVKRQSKNFKPDLFTLKVEALQKKVLSVCYGDTLIAALYSTPNLITEVVIFLLLTKAQLNITQYSA